MKNFKRVVMDCELYPETCDGGVSCWADCQPTEKQCKRCDCAYCKHGECDGKKKVQEGGNHE